MNIKDFLYQSFLQLKNKEEVAQYLRDLLTEAEIEEFARRLMVADLLNQNVPYSQIIDASGMSSTTISRINKWLQKGKNGYKMVLSRLHRSSTLNE